MTATQIRNSIVHEPGHRFTSDELSGSLVMLDRLNDHLTTLVYEYEGTKGGEPDQMQDAKDLGHDTD